MRALALATMLCGVAASAAGQDLDALRKVLSERIEGLRHIDEITKTPIPGLYEVRVESDVFYTDARGDYLIKGEIRDTRSKANLTQERLDALSAIDFGKLQLGDAIVWKRGTGQRKLVVYADPNCPYCKKFEQSLQTLDNVTVFTFLIPILGGDSPEKARNIWCSKDSTSAWSDWMLQGKPPLRAMGPCDSSAISRNMAAVRRYRINGTPTIVFENGSRISGAVPIEDIQIQLTQESQRKGLTSKSFDTGTRAQ